ncbi:MAG: threonine synthase [Gammaproteobacteria bacterium]|nr:threonine synthase [Gammaproteobacteria bacterium]
MRYLSTRNGPEISLEDAIMSGTAPDGGLYVPANLPTFAPADFDGIDAIDHLAAKMLQPFFAGSVLENQLAEICTEAFSFEAPSRVLEEGGSSLSVLELFHGPTAAFKDFGARFLAACMVRIAASRKLNTPLTILVATSGDTGGAVAAAFHGKPGVRVLVLFPDGRVSSRQQHQLTCWDDNVTSLSVKGEFDDCQSIVKELFADRALSAEHNLCSANSINVGRLLPQSVYYALSSLQHFRKTGEQSSYVIPTGNLGNGFACVWAKSMGFPIDRIVLATNANRTIPDFLDRGEWQPRASIATLASAMDVGNPSNMERLRSLWGEADSLNSRLSTYSVSDAQIREQIVAEHEHTGVAWCPHTATAFYVYRHHLTDTDRAGHWKLVATAHAAKFEAIVEPLVHETLELPEELARILKLPSAFDTVQPTAAAVAQFL